MCVLFWGFFLFVCLGFFFFFFFFFGGGGGGGFSDPSFREQQHVSYEVNKSAMFN